MSELMGEFFGNGRLNGHAVKSPVDELAQLSVELVQLRQRIETLQAGIQDAMARVVTPENIAKAAKTILAKKGYRVDFAAEPPGSPLNSIFEPKRSSWLKSYQGWGGDATLSRRQTESCLTIFGPDAEFCRGNGKSIRIESADKKIPMKKWLALVELLGPDQALVFKAENGIIVESGE